MSKDLKSISFDQIIKKILEIRKDLGDLNEEMINKTWIGFINHLKEELELNHKIKVYDIFVVSYTRNDNNYFLEFNNYWLKKNGLIQNLVEDLPIIPIRKLFPQNLKKFVDLPVEIIADIYDAIIAEIERLLCSYENHLELDLKYFGKIMKIEKKISFAHYKKFMIEKQPAQKGRTVLDIVRMKAYEEETKKNLNSDIQKKLNSFQIIKKKELLPLKSLLLNDNLSLKPNQDKKLFKIKNNNNQHLKTKLDKSIFKNLENFKNQKFATHPASLDHEYSKLTSEPNKLIEINFKFPNQIKQPPPLIFDPYSYTLACPLNLQYNSLSISSRIAINYTPLSQYLYFNFEKQKITILHNNENKALFLRQNLEEYKAETKEIVSKRRYDQYLFEILGDETVIDFPTTSLEKILQNNGNYKNISSDELRTIKSRLETEIKSDFKIAAKKAVLDYILKEDEEKLRLGIEEVPDPVVDYGKGRYKFSFDKIGDSFASRKKKLEKELVLFSKTTHKIVDCFVEFENECIFDLGFEQSQPKDLDNFLNIQREKMNNIRNRITNNWVKNISQIYKKNMINQSKPKMKKYFDCISSVISQQIRGLIVNSLKAYLNFFKKYDKKEIPKIEDCLLNKKKSTDHLEKSFLILNVREKNGTIIFENDLDYVKEQLLDLYRDGVRSSENIPRPENFFYRSEKNVLNIIELRENFIRKSLLELKEIIEKNFNEIKRMNVVFKDFEHLFFEGEKINQILNQETIQKETLIKYYQDYTKLEHNIIYNIPQNIYMNMVKINCSSLKNSFLDIIANLKLKIIDRVQSEIFKLNKKIANDLKISFDSITIKVESSVERLIQIDDNISNFKKIKYWEIVKDFDLILDWFEDFYLLGAKLNQDILKEIWDTKNKIAKSKDELSNEEKRIEKERKKLDENNERDKESINYLIKSCNEHIDILKTKGLKYEYEKHLTTLKEILKKYEEGEKKIEIINYEEKKLKKAKSDFAAFKEAGRILRIFEDLWTMVEEWSKEKLEWEKTNIFNLDVEKMDENIQTKTKKFSKIIKEFTIMGLDKQTENEDDDNIKNPYILSKDMMKAIKMFKDDISVLKSICQEGIKQRHWISMNNLLVENNIGINLNPSNVYLIKNLKESGIKNLKKELEEIADIAVKEYLNEKILNSVEDEWEKKELNLDKYKIPNSFILTSNEIDDIQTNLEEHIIKLQTMKGSQYAVVYKNRIIELEKKLFLIKETLEVWLNVQTLWIYLEPIFSSEDIIKSLPKEGGKFREINKEFFEFMNLRKYQPNIIDLTLDNSILEKLQVNLKELELIDKNLENYLDKKRSQFPRFYFLSSDSLIDILSQSKNPSQIQKYIKILFEGINELKFSEDEEIEGMISSEGEYIQFEQKIVPKYYKGLVERWLNYLEEVMAYEVKKFILQSLSDYSNMSKDDFLFNTPGQAIVNVLMTVWTFETESTINDPEIDGLEDYLLETINSISYMVSLFDSDLSKVERCSLETCIVISVHNRDVIKQLINSNVQSINDFEFEAQMRYYWECNDKKEEVADNEANVRIMNTSHPYKYEYLGNSPRLVITPLTDKCYRTLCSAIYLFYGGAPEGPAGTGKTETVKDLAKALARMIVVFNCSDKFNYKSMERFLKGLACSGGWSCFDEFNRIELEVLSVIAQQLQKIQNALVENKTEFIFGGSLIKIKNTCNCFITMNPGYSGRSELPDNLKALFRSVAMMVPDYAIIAEIRLFSYGFKKAGELAVKIVTTYKLCSEQISPQKHYDYGMRAVNSTLVAAGNLKKIYPKEEEDLQVLRAIYQVNVSKFLSEDLHLFFSITKDLFLNKTLENNENSQLSERINQTIIKLNLENNPYFYMKINQLNETLEVRHGVMMVGSTYGGKSSALKVLKNLEENISTFIINPKAIDSSFLYGFTDMVSNEWTDGVLTLRFKELIKLNDSQKKWLIFDGPVDAVWIENLNTVLDDNKKLCLSNGDVFYMAQNMNMIFEVEDLAEASPATVSRCGMVYFENKNLGWFVIYKSWQKSLPSNFQDFDIEKMDVFFLTILSPIFSYIKNKKLILLQPASEQQIVKTLLDIASEYIQIFKDKQIYENMDFKERLTFLDIIFIYATFWSLGVLIHPKNRKAFDTNLKKLINICDASVLEEDRKSFRKIKVQEAGTLYDYKIEIRDTMVGNLKKKTIKWIKWNSFLDSNITLSESKTLHNILIETEETLKYREFLNMYINSKKHILICGPSGTGKTSFLFSILQELNPSKTLFSKMCFSGQTSCYQLQENIENKLYKKPSKNKFGPYENKDLIFFIDDMNMPKKEIHGAQPPIELLRQYIEHNGFYELKDKHKEFKTIQNTFLICSMTLHNSSNIITSRFLRYFNIIPFIEFNNDQMFRIFNAILTLHFSEGFDEKILNKVSKITSSILDIYEMVKNTFLPLPSKIHYMFNLRDMSKVVKGICASSKEFFQTPEQVFKLIAHEVWRVFGDRLNSQEDRLNLLNKILKPVFNKMSSVNFDQSFSNLDLNNDNKIDNLVEMRELIFTNIAGNNYEEITDKTNLLNILKKSLELLNEESESPLDIVLFNFAIEHLLIINRILQQRGGHALLIGTGGSGRQSLTRLASFISDYKFFMLNLSDSYVKDDWREDLKKIIKSAGAKKNTVFFFSENQIKDDFFIEDINNLLNNGEVPNLFNAEDKGEIMEIIQNTEGKNILDLFTEEVKKYLHIFLSFSQIGNNFKENVKMYPSIVNCCNVDWFFEWPEDALTAIAHHYIDEIPLQTEEIENCIEIIKYLHFTSKEFSDLFRIELKRVNYVTGSSFLEMLIQFKNLYHRKQKEVIGKKNTYLNGFQMIIESEEIVEQMKEMLKRLKPDLEKAKIETQDLMEKVAISKKEADKIQNILAQEEAEVSEKANEAKIISDECQKQIDEIQPEIDRANDVVKKLNKKNFEDLKLYSQPPLPIKYALQCMCIILGTKPELKKDPKTFRMTPDWWATSKKMLNDFDIKKLNEAEMDDQKHKKLVELFTNPETSKYLELSTIEYSSPTAAGMFLWITAQKKLFVVNKELTPKRKALEEATVEFNRVNEILKEKTKSLEEINKKVENLNFELNQIKDKKQKLEIQYENCIVQTQRAHKLIDNLSDEKVRWKEIAEQLEKSVKSLIGFVLLSAGFAAYLGPFTGSFRERIINKWQDKIKDYQMIETDSQFNLINFLGDQIKIRNWVINGLPSDFFSVSNSIIMENSVRYPLFIDPQFQANKFIKQFKKNEKLQILQLNQGDFLKKLENAIRFGLPVLIENINETLPNNLDSLLLKQTFRNGNSLSIKLEDEIIDFNSDFELFLTTKLGNPHYLPNISTKTKILNFMITEKGLKDQILNLLVVKENPTLESERQNILIEGFKNRKQLGEIEEKILEILSFDKSKLIEDETALDVLTASKKKSLEVMEKQKIADKTEKEIEEVRLKYFTASEKITKLFFAVNDLSKIDSMYEYSLMYFLDLVEEGIKNSPKSPEFEERLKNIYEHFLDMLYKNISRSIFVKDKLVFSFLIVKKLKELEEDSDIKNNLFRFLLTGVLSTPKNYRNKPNVEWMNEKSWQEILELTLLDSKFEKLADHLENNLDYWKSLVFTNNLEEFEFPDIFNGFLTEFDKLVLFKIFRPDKVVLEIKKYIKNNLGEKFVNPPQFDLESIYLETSSRIPILFILTPGVDPFINLKKISDSFGIKLENVSLGQGQGPLAQRLIKEALTEGTWIVLQNCHLAESFMKTLEIECENLRNKDTIVSKNFRIWLTSYPTEKFPLSILQNSLKLTNEPPKGLKNNLLNCLNSDIFKDSSFFMFGEKNEILYRLVYSLCFFHSLIQERKSFGPLGWNIPYEFTESDLRISARQIKVFLEKFTYEIPLVALNYLISQCNYGGRVTDDKDKRLIKTLLEQFLNRNMVISKDYLIDPTLPDYSIPYFTYYKEMLTYTDSLPDETIPGILGFHPNACITKDINHSNEFLNTVLKTQNILDQNSDSNSSFKILELLMKEIPEPFNEEEIAKSYPFKKEESMNTVLQQDTQKFNKLIYRIKKNLVDISASLEGKQIFTTQLEEILNSILNGKVPQAWFSVSYPSLKPLSSYLDNLRKRVEFFKNWIKKGKPLDFWISGFFFTQGFLTSVLQNYSRCHNIPIDQIQFNVQVVPESFDSIKESVDEVYINGMFLEGASFDYQNFKLTESLPRILYLKNFRVKLLPISKNNCEPSLKQKENLIYDCPLYRTAERRGELLTTGHSTNFVTYFGLPTSVDPNRWIKRGVALLLELPF